MFKFHKIALVAMTALLGATASHAWDPLGDLRNPGRIVRNVQREAGAAAGNVQREVTQAGREIDRMRLEAQVQASAPVLEQWLHQSRNNASQGAMPIPQHIRQQLEGFFDADTLNRVRFKVGDAGVLNLAALSISYGGARAVTLIDVVVFKNGNDAHNDAVLWAHELRHVQQFRDWGVRDFSIRYLRSWNSVENDAESTERAFANWPGRQAQGPARASYPPPQMQFAQQAQFCATPVGACPMMVALPVGVQCLCSGAMGSVPGFTR